MMLCYSSDRFRQLRVKYSGILIQLAKYGVSGCAATITHIVLFHLFAWKIFPALQKEDFFVSLLQLPVTPTELTTRTANSMFSNVAAFMGSNMVAYLANTHWVFEAGRHSKLLEIYLFYMVSGISLLLGSAIMWFFISFLGMLTTTAFIANVFVAVMVNYVIRKYYIFKG